MKVFFPASPWGNGFILRSRSQIGIQGSISAAKRRRSNGRWRIASPFDNKLGFSPERSFGPVIYLMSDRTPSS